MTQQLFARQWQTTVRKVSSGIRMGTIYLDNNCELEGCFVVDSRNFTVASAWLDIHRGPWQHGSFELPKLIGKEAYLGAGKVFRAATEEDESGIWTEVMLEGLKGLLQTEYWLWRERGFASIQDYHQYYQKRFADSCIYYSYPPEAKRSFEQHAGQNRGEGLLFTRSRYSDLERAENQFSLSASMVDSYHQMTVSVSLSADERVLAANGQVVRSPDVICQTGEQRMPNLTDTDFAPAAWQKAVGGSRGCTHLADLSREVLRTYLLFKSQSA